MVRCDGFGCVTKEASGSVSETLVRRGGVSQIFFKGRKALLLLIIILSLTSLHYISEEKNEENKKENMSI